MIVFLVYLLVGERKQAQPDPPGGDCQGTWTNISRIFPECFHSFLLPFQNYFTFDNPVL